MEITLSSTEETKELAKKIAKDIKPHDVLALYGDLGSGKTTFTRYFVEAMGEMSRVQSPTFIIMRKYGNISHVDLYRLTTKEEVQELDLPEIIENSDVTIIEWPELAEDFLLKDAKKLYFEYIDENTRKVTL